MTPLEERVQTARDELFPRYDALNALWLKVEEQLTATHIPRPVVRAYSHALDPNGSSDSDEIHDCLGLQKIRGKWRICYSLFYDTNPIYEDWKPITECSAHIRVEAAKHVEVFRKAIVDSAESFIPHVDDAIDRLATFLGLATPPAHQDSQVNHQHD